MSGADAGVVAVLTADRIWFERVRGLWSGGADLSLRWIPEPLGLEQRLPPIAGDTGLLRSDDRLLGLILDLTTPQLSVSSPSDTAERQPSLLHNEAELTWLIGASLATLSSCAHLPVLLASESNQLEDLLHHFGLLVVERVRPDASDDRWKRALDRLLAQGSTRNNGASVTTERVSAAFAPPRRLALRPDVHLDTSRWALHSDIGEVHLTEREAEVLHILMQAPGRFHGRADLARRVSRPGAYPVGEHCIEQTISGLRRKLGESAKGSCLIAHRRGFGYALMVRRAGHFSVSDGESGRLQGVQ